MRYGLRFTRIGVDVTSSRRHVPRACLVQDDVGTQKYNFFESPTA